MNHLKKTMLVTTLLGAFSGAASAELISTHYITDGDNRATLDTTTGKEWFNLLTDSRSIDWVINETKKGGSLEGWRLPRYEEVRRLMSYIVDESKSSEFVSLFGGTRSYYYGTAYNGYTRTWSQGYVLTDDGSVALRGAYNAKGGGYVDSILNVDTSYSNSSSMVCFSFQMAG